MAQDRGGELPVRFRFWRGIHRRGKWRAWRKRPEPAQKAHLSIAKIRDVRERFRARQNAPDGIPNICFRFSPLSPVNLDSEPWIGIRAAW